MISSMVEAAIRSIGVAFIVGMGLRLFRMRNVLAQKAAWSLVLAAALAMPFAQTLPQTLPRNWRVLPVSMTMHLPAAVWRPGQALPANSQTAPLHSRAAAQQFQVEPAVAGGNHFPEPLVFQPALNPAAQAAEIPGVVVAATGAHRLGVLWGTLRQLRLTALAWVLYCAVVGVLLMRLGYGLAMAAWIWHRAEPVTLGTELAGRGLGFDSGFAVRSSSAVYSPVTVGSGVLLPSDFRQWDVEKLRIVLAHEQSHIRHADFYLQVVAGLYGALFWFSPLGWWLKRKLSELSEAISDLAGLEEAASRITYAQLLVEFAALPRPTLIGVAMARTSSLSLRIDRLLDETIFRQAFAGKRRLLLAVLLVPVALFAATGILRVEAAGQTAPRPPATVAASVPALAPAAPQEPITGVSNPDAAPAPAAAPAGVPAPPNPPDVAAPAAPTPYPHAYGEIHDSADDKAQSSSTSESGDNVSISSQTDRNGKHVRGTSIGHGYSYSYSSNGDSWAVVTGPDQHISFNGEWNDGTKEAIEKARKLSNGKFLWFNHAGKSYFIDDPAVLAQIQAMYKPMEELGRQQEELGRQQEKLGQQQAALANEQSQTRVPTPDMSSEIAQVEAAMAKLKAERNAKVSQEELAEVQDKLAEMQGRLGEIQGRMGDRAGDYGEKQGHLGELQGKLGEQQGRLGEQEGKLAGEADRKVKGIIEQSLREGKARPVQ
jgi:hypothetical protein